jgi:hypothetical protein
MCKITTAGKRRANLLLAAGMLFIFIFSIGTAAQASPARPAAYSSDYTPLPVWSDSSKINAIVVGEFDSSHPGKELAVCDDSGSVVLLRESS